MHLQNNAASDAHPPTRPKVFCVGMFKTGTTSLGLALERLGFRASYRFWNQFPTLAPYFDLDTRKFEPLAPEIRARADRFDAFSDAPWLFLYRELDEWYPGSRFVLTLRSSSEALLKSELAHWDRLDIMKQWLAQEGCRPKPEWFIQRYEKHNQNVRTYFAERPDDLLELSLETEPQPWRRLCKFVGVDVVPEEPFPHANRAPTTEPAFDTLGGSREIPGKA